MFSTATEENQGWTVKTCNERSDDGKTFTSSRVATTSGTDKLDNGIANYAAKSEMKSSVFMDGDDKNFTKSVGSSATNVIKQEACGGDENSKFSATSTSTSSSSRYVTESKSTSEDIVPVQSFPSGGGKVVTKTYTSNVPQELKTHPNYVEGRTKVTTETRTLADGSVVKTTRYETRGDQTISSSSQQQQQQSSRSYHDTSSRRSSTSSSISKGDNSNHQVIKKEIDIQPTIVESKQSTNTVKSSSQQSKTQQSQNYQTSSSETVRVSSSSKQDNQCIGHVRDTVSDDIVLTRQVDLTPKTSETRITSDGNNYQTSSSSSTTVKVSSASYDLKENADVHQATNVHSTKHIASGDITDGKQIIRHIKTDLTPTVVEFNTITTTTGDKSVDVKQESTSTTKATKVTSEEHVKTSTRTGDVKIIQNNATNKATIDGDNQTRKVIKETTTVTSIIDDCQPITQTTNTMKTTHHDNSIKATEQFINIENQQVTRNKEISNDNFIDVERKHIIDTSSVPQTPHFIEEASGKQAPCKEIPAYETPERRQPIRPGKSELDEKSKPTEGQYDTTYRSDFTNKRISVDVSPTHNAFARSLRAVSPDRSSKCSSPSRGSTRSLSSSTPDRRQSNRISPERRIISPTKPTDKFSSSETISKSPRSSPTKTDHVINTDTITRRSKITNRSQTDVDVRKQTSETRTFSSDTLTRKKKVADDDIVNTIDSNNIGNLKQRFTTKPRSRSNSPTSTVSDFEYVKTTNEQVTDLDEETTKRVNTTVQSKSSVGKTKITDTRPTSLDVFTTKQTKKILERSPTSPLPSPNKQRPSPTKESPNRRSSLKSPTKDSSSREDRPLKRTDTYEERCRQILGIDKVEKAKTTKQTNITTLLSDSKSPEKPESPTKVKEFPSQTRKSPEKSQPTRTSPTKERSPQLPELPSHVKKLSKESPVAKTKPKEHKLQLQEFPSQIRKSPEKELPKFYPEKKKPSKEAPSLQEFPSQARKSPEKELLESYPEKQKPPRKTASVQGLPSQIRKTPEKETLEPETEKEHPSKNSSSIQEFPSQIRKSPEKEPLEPYSLKEKTCKEAPSIQEFPSQIRKSPNKESLPPYSEKQKPSKTAPSVNEFPSQIRKSPEKELPESSPKTPKPLNEATSLQEFPAQIRKSPENEPLEPYPEKQKPCKQASSLHEIPSQIKKFPEKESLEPYSEKQIPSKVAPSVQEFPSQIRKSPEKETLEPYPEKKKPSKEAPSVQEFPSQIRKSPEKETLEPYPEKTKPTKETSLLQEFPSQMRKSSEKEPLPPYPEKAKPQSEISCIQEFPSQIRKSPEKEPLPQFPEKLKPSKEAPSVQEFPSQVRKPLGKQSPIQYSDRPAGQPKKSPEHQAPAKKEPKKERSPSESSSTSSDEEERRIITEIETEIDVNQTRKDKALSKTQQFIETEISIEHSQRPKPLKTAKSPDKKPVAVSEVIVNKSSTHKTELEKKPVKKSPVKETPVKKSPGSKTTPLYESHTPIKEPEFVKKFAYTLGSDEELRKTQETHHKTVKKDLSQTIEKQALLEKDKKTKPKTPTSNKVISKIFIDKKDSQNKFNIEGRRNEIVVQRLHETITKSKQLLNGDTRKRPSDVTPSKSSPKTATPKKTEIKINVTNGKVTSAISQAKKVKPTVQTVPPKRHVVTTTLTVSPKSKQSEILKTKTTSTRTTQITKSKTTAKQPKKAKIQNGHVSTDSESESDVEGTTEVTTTEIKRTVNGKVDTDEKTTKVTKTHSKVPKTESPKPTRAKPETKCVATKSIIINNEISTPTSIIVDLQRSKSSREPSPDHLCPHPVSSDDDSGVPRYPDKITEPDDASLRRKPKRLSDIPIIETEVTTDFNRVTEVTSKKDAFIEEEIQREEATRRGPSVPKEDEKPDDSLLSVSDKVNKFITTAQQLTTTQNLPKRPKSPRCENYTDTNVDENDESLLSVSEKISHFATTAKKITDTEKVKTSINTESDKPVSLSKLNISPKRTSPAKEVPTENRKASLSRLSPEKERSPSPKYVGAKEPESTPKSSRRLSGDDQKCVLSSVSRLRSTESIKKAKALFEKIGKEPDTPKQRDILSRPSVFSSPKKAESPTVNRSEVSTARSKLDFSKEETACSVRTIDGKDTKLKSTRLILDGIKPRASSPEKQAPQKVQPSSENDVPGYMKPLDRSEHKHRTKSPSPQREPEMEEQYEPRSRDSSADRDIPGYMKPLDRSLRPHSPNREGVEALRKIGSIPKEEVDTRVSKFGVTLRRTDSGRAVKTTEQRKASTTVEETLQIEKEIEEIYDLEVLEAMVSFIVS